MMIAGSLYRFDTYLVAFRPGPQWSYFPSVPELAVTIGLVSLEIMTFIAIVKVFPIMAMAPAVRDRQWTEPARLAAAARK
jgi:Ni/Fe-hydrogenase subunit HybB-like protein